jgi:hypothetical protein
MWCGLDLLKPCVKEKQNNWESHIDIRLSEYSNYCISQPGFLTRAQVQ